MNRLIYIAGVPLVLQARVPHSIKGIPQPNQRSALFAKHLLVYVLASEYVRASVYSLFICNIASLACIRSMCGHMVSQIKRSMEKVRRLVFS